MNLIEAFQNLVTQAPEALQALVVTLAGAVPFVEGEGAVTIGIIGGVHPAIAAIAAFVGNLLCVTVFVQLSWRARRAVVDRQRARALVATDGATVVDAPDAVVHSAGLEPKQARREKFQRAFARYGVPGVSLLGPLLLPTMFTASMLAALGITRARILLWQAIAIATWTTMFAIIFSGVVAVAG